MSKFTVKISENEALVKVNQIIEGMDYTCMGKININSLIEENPNLQGDDKAIIEKLVSQSLLLDALIISNISDNSRSKDPKTADILDLIAKELETLDVNYDECDIVIA